MSAVIEERRGSVLVLKLNNPPVNGLGAGLRANLAAALAAGQADDGVAAFVLVGEGRMYSAGADIREFGKMPPAGTPDLNDVINTLEMSGKPVVSAIHGVAAGGGLELALGTHYRIGVAKTRVGLPEVTLGILPGAGGTQRLPRLAGVANALDLITSGRLIPVEQAHALGIIDEIADGDILDAAVAAAERLIASGTAPRRSREQDAGLAAARGNPGLFDDFRKGMAKMARGMNAPDSCVRCIEAAISMPFDAGLKFEREAFTQLVVADEAKSMQHAFFAEREAAKIPDVPTATPARDINNAAVIGCGTMGGGIAMTFANAGIPVIVIENDQTSLEAGLAKVQGNYSATVAKGRLSQHAMDQRLGLISGSTDFKAVADADIIIEAVFEDMEVKKRVFSKLDQFCKPSAILATNTSTLDVDQIATMTKRPENVIGMHFFSPANVMRLLENVRGTKTSAKTIATVMKLSKTINKVGVLVGVCDGFVGNRMLHQYSREANFLLEEGALPQQVDRVIYEFGFPMGPFTMGDMAGLDVSWLVRKRKLAESQNNNRYSSIADRICEQGRFGQKTGSGWYRYEAGSRAPVVDPAIEKLIIQTSVDANIERREISDEEVLKRCLYPLINEGAKILEEGLAIRASDIDVIWTLGYGFPRYRGGPMFWADTIGLDEVYKTMQRYHSEHSELMRPAPLLERLAKRGKKISEFRT